MDGRKLLKLLISFLIILQVVGFVFRVYVLDVYSKIVLGMLITLLYFVSTRRIIFSQVLVLFVLLLGELMVFFNIENEMKLQMIMHVIAYIMLFYFLYYNHKSFVYNRRDVFTLVLGSSLYTVIFFMAYFILRKPMGDLYLLGFLHLLLLYVLLIVAAMHYINIRSEKSLWFFLSMLNFSFSDFMLLIDTFYLQSNELKVLMMICEPLALIFLVNYMITKSLTLKSEEFEGF